MKVAMPDVRFVQDRDGAIVLDIRSDRFFSLNPTAAFIWAHLVAGKSPLEIAQKLSLAAGIDTDLALADTHQLIAALEERGLIQSLVPKSGNSSRWS
jgi:hypothetical protein